MNEEINSTYLAGFIAGLLLVAVFMIIAIIIKRKKGMNKKYDERQKAIQGVAYKIGFLTCIGYFIVNGIFCDIIYKPWGSITDMNFVGVCLGIIAMAGYSIMKNAYISIGEKEKSYLFLFIIVAIINIMCFFINSGMLFDDKPQENVYSLNLYCGITFFILSAVLGVKMIMDRVNSKKEMEE